MYIYIYIYKYLYIYIHTLLAAHTVGLQSDTEGSSPEAQILRLGSYHAPQFLANLFFGASDSKAIEQVIQASAPTKAKAAFKKGYKPVA